MASSWISCGHPGGGQIEILGCWASACCHQHRVGGECLIVGDDVDMVTCFIAGGHLRSGDDGDPFTLKHFAHCAASGEDGQNKAWHVDTVRHRITNNALPTVDVGAPSGDGVKLFSGGG